MMNCELNRVVIIGSGNVAEALARAVTECKETHLLQLWARNQTRAAEIAALTGCTWSSQPEELATADLYLLAVSDRAVADVAATLPIPADAAVAHTAGSVPLEALPYARRAVFYPLQTFTRGRHINWSGVPIFIEAATPELQTQIGAFARKLSRQVLHADSARRARLHLAGVFANNFANHMFSLSARLIADAGLDFDLLKPLIAETTAKALDAASPIEVQTGPAVRGDLATQERHAAMLDNEQLQTIYSTISQSIWETSKKI